MATPSRSAASGSACTVSRLQHRSDLPPRWSRVSVRPGGARHALGSGGAGATWSASRCRMPKRGSNAAIRDAGVIANCTADGVNLSQSMVAVGLGARRSSARLRAICRLEEGAKEARSGLWSGAVRPAADLAEQPGHEQARGRWEGRVTWRACVALIRCQAFARSKTARHLRAWTRPAPPPACRIWTSRSSIGSLPGERAEQLAISLRASPSFDAFGRDLDRRPALALARAQSAARLAAPRCFRPGSRGCASHGSPWDRNRRPGTTEPEPGGPPRRASAPAMPTRRSPPPIGRPRPRSDAGEAGWPGGKGLSRGRHGP